MPQRSYQLCALKRCYVLREWHSVCPIRCSVAVRRRAVAHDYFMRTTPGLSAYLAIPNNIDDHHSDILPAVPVPYVQPLTAAPSSDDRFATMTVTGSQALEYSVTLDKRDVRAHSSSGVYGGNQPLSVEAAHWHHEFRHPVAPN